MRKIFLLAVLVLLACCAGSNAENGLSAVAEKEDVGAENAKQYVIENLGSENIESISVSEHDRLLSDIRLGFGQIQLLKAQNSYLLDEITLDSLERAADEFYVQLTDVANSLQYGSVVNDSLATVYPDSYDWLKTYRVTVKMKSSKERYFRVVMESDSITPRCFDRKVLSKLTEHSNKFQKCWRDIEKEKRYLRSGRW